MGAVVSTGPVRAIRRSSTGGLRVLGVVGVPAGQLKSAVFRRFR